MNCPECGADCDADFVDNGVGTERVGPWRCEACGWVEEPPDVADLDDPQPLKF